jgi:queuine/archaeosine tRNA-ribosyltransferase
MCLIYSPVSTGSNDLINTYHPNCLFNVTSFSQNFTDNFNHQPNTQIFGDSGGLQFFRSRIGEIKKRYLIVPFRQIKHHKNKTAISPIALCNRYREMDVRFGFTLDSPVLYDASEIEYLYNLERSYEWAKLMLTLRDKMCPKTELFIPLHYCDKLQLHTYFDKMSELNPNGFAFPSGAKSDLYWTIRTACTLCFLSMKQVKKVHMLGSSKRDVIIIGAAVLSMGMFDHVSFDSKTWNTKINNKQPICIHPKTLIQRKLELNFELHELSCADSFNHLIMQNSSLYQYDNFKLLMLNNAFAISQYSASLAKFSSTIDDLKNYLPNLSLRGQSKDRSLIGIKILEAYQKKGYGYLEKWLSWIW